MEVSQFYQQAFLRSAEKLISAEAETSAMLEQLAQEKERAIEKKIVGKEFYYDSLEGVNAWDYEKYKGYKYKAVKVETTVMRDITGNIKYASSGETGLIGLKVYFMRNPVEVLESKKQLTNKETELLKELVWWWKNTKNGKSPIGYKIRDVLDIHRDLHVLKHKLYMVLYLSWDFDFMSITSDSFIERGLKAEKSLC